MDIEMTLNEELLMQPFAELPNESDMLNQGKHARIWICPDRKLDSSFE